MAHRTVAASRGIDWLSTAASLVYGNAAVFLVMGLIIGVIGLIPILGGLALLIAGPALYGGIVYAAREQHQGRKAEIGQLFQAFQQEGRLPQMLLLCLPTVALMIVAFVLAIMLAVAVGAAGLASGGSEPDVAALLAAGGAVGFIGLLVIIALGVLVWALLFFAIPKVMLEGDDAFPAMKLSFSAALANIGAFLLYGIVVAIVYLVVAVVGAMIGAWLGGLVASTLVLPVAVTGMYFAFRDVFGGAEPTVETPAPPPPGPAPPPPNPPPPAA